MAVASNPLESFLWGAGGAKKTPEQVAREREIAAALMQGGSDYSPVQHWLQGAARVAQSGAGAFRDWRADNAETAGMERGQAAMDPLLAALGMGGGGAAAPSPYGSSPAVPSTADAAALRQGMIDRGLPEHVADGFLMNFQDESGLNPGINEQNPTVPGSRGGYGLYQLTGPRRVAYEQYAQQNGVDPSDPNAQLDFMMSELAGPEASAYQAIMAAPDSGSAAAAIAAKFLRPAQQHLDERVARYTGGQPTQVASLDPSIGAPQAQPAQLPPIAPSQSAQPSQGIADALMPQQQAQAPTQQANGILPLLMAASGDPWARKQYGGVIDALMGQQMQQMDPRYQQQMQAGQLGIEKSQMELDAMRNPAPQQAGMFEGTGMDAQAWNILQTASPDSKEYATAYSIIAQPKPQMVQTENGMMLVPVAPQLPAWLTPPGGSPAPQAPAGNMPMPESAPQAPLMPQGQSQANPAVFDGGMAGPGQLIPNTKKPTTEAQQRNEMLGTVLTSDLQTINDNFDALGDPQGQLLGMIPGGLGNAWQSEEYQQAANAVSSSVANILYSVSGASANPGETENQIRNLTPALGDKPGTIADKKRRLNVFVNAVAAASGNPEIIAKAREESIRGLGAPMPNAQAAPTGSAPAQTGGYPEGTVIEDGSGRQMVMQNGAWVEVM